MELKLFQFFNIGAYLSWTDGPTGKQYRGAIPVYVYNYNTADDYVSLKL
jgi:hypothetical protein